MQSLCTPQFFKAVDVVIGLLVWIRISSIKNVRVGLNSLFVGKCIIFAWYFCDRNYQAAYAQSFALWQQATIEFTCHDHSIIACSRHIYVWCCSPRTSRSWWITQSTQHHRRGCNNTLRIISLLTLLWRRPSHRSAKLIKTAQTYRYAETIIIIFM